jgi:hypothetical protein
MTGNSKKRVLAVIAAAALMTVPMFAKGMDRDRNGCGDDNRCEKTGRGGMMRINVMGTVSSVTKDTIVITNSDGKDIEIHLNPFTKVMKAEIDEDSCRPENRPEIIKIEDVRKGDWVGISSFDTGTSVLEARMIVVPESK